MRKITCILISCLILVGAPAGAPLYEPQDFSYLVEKVQGLGPELLKMHFKLYQGYVANTNKLLGLIDEMNQRGEQTSIAYGALKRRMGWEMDGMLLHEAYFGNLGGKAAINADSLLYKQIAADFGSYDAWEKDFKSTGLIRGIGWVILYRDPKNGQLQNVWINEHDVGHVAGGGLLLVMDVWEHAYITEFGLNRSGYIDTFFKNINWNVVEQRFNAFAETEQPKPSRSLNSK